MLNVTPLCAPNQAELVEMSELCLRSKAHWGYDAAFLEACIPTLTLTQEKAQAGPMAITRGGGRIAGLVQVSVEGRSGSLERLFVDPPFIGKGHGAALMDWAIKVAIALGGHHLDIEADPDAVPFYQRHGATRIGEAPSAAIPGRNIPLLRLPLLRERPGN